MARYRLYWLAALFGLLAWLLGMPIGLGLAAILLAAAIVGSLTSAPIAAEVVSDRRIDRDLVKQNEWLQVEVSVRTAGFAPLRWAAVREKVASGATVAGSTCVLTFGAPNSRSAFSYRVCFERRGRYTLGPASLHYGDPFGLAEHCRDAREVTEVCVHPNVVRIPPFAWPSHLPFGSERARRSEYEDLSRPVGAREYAPRDEVRRIHWKAFARTGTLMVREYEGGSRRMATIVVDLCDSSYAADQDFELAMVAAASLMSHFVVARVPTELRAGGVARMTGPDASLRDGLRLLAAAERSREPLGAELARPGEPLPWRSTLFAISPRLDPPSAAMLDYGRQRGHAVCLILIGAGGGVPNIACDGLARVRSEDDLTKFTLVQP